MDWAQFITELIANNLFPIVACGALFWKINDQDKSHKEEMTGMTQAVNNNTLAITKLVDTLEK